MLDKNVDASWLETEMCESVTLLRKKLEKLNDIHADDLDEDEVREIKDIYKSLYYIFSIKKAIKVA